MGTIMKKQGNSVARDLPPTGSEANTTIPPPPIFVSQKSEQGNGGYIGYRFPLYVPIYYMYLGKQPSI